MFIAEDEGGVLQIKSPDITGEANEAPIPIPCFKLPHRTLAGIFVDHSQEWVWLYCWKYETQISAQLQLSRQNNADGS